MVVTNSLPQLSQRQFSQRTSQRTSETWVALQEGMSISKTRQNAQAIRAAQTAKDVTTALAGARSQSSRKTRSATRRSAINGLPIAPSAFSTVLHLLAEVAEEKLSIPARRHSRPGHQAWKGRILSDISTVIAFMAGTHVHTSWRASRDPNLASGLAPPNETCLSVLSPLTMSVGSPPCCRCRMLRLTD